MLWGFSVREEIVTFFSEIFPDTESIVCACLSLALSLLDVRNQDC